MSGSQVPPPPPGAVTEGGENAVVIRKQVVREAGKDQARTTESLGTEQLRSHANALHSL
jgi:hypothetical protein